MEGLITKEQAFNNGFESYGRVVSLENLLSFSVNNNVITEEDSENIIESYKESMYKYIMSTVDTDDYDLDLSQVIKGRIEYIFDAINDCLYEMKNPMKALEYILNMSPLDVITSSIKRFEEQKSRILTKLGKLQDDFSLVFTYDPEFKNMLNDFKSRAKKYNNINYIYRTLDYSVVGRIESLTELESVIDDYLLDASILSKFDQKELTILFKRCFNKFVTDNYYVLIALNNYLFNNFYKDTQSVLLSDNMNDIITRDIKLSFFGEEDVEEVFTEGPIKFSEEEKKHILDKYTKYFVYDFVENKHIDSIIRKNM